MTKLLKMLLFVGVLAVSTALIAALLPAPAPAAVAQGDYTIPTITPSPEPPPTRTPAPDPTGTAAAAAITIEEASMTSAYPEGVVYTVRASSTAGAIDRVQVSYRTREGTPTSATLDWDAERDAFTYFDRRYQPPWDKVFYRFRIRDEAGNVLQTEEFDAEYADNTRKWVRRENDEVIVLMTGARDDLADSLFVSSSQAIEVLEEAFGFSLDYRPYVVVMDHASFQEWQQYPEPTLAGRTTDGYTVQTLSFGEGDLVDTTVPHELTHIFQGFIAEARDTPGWFIEGHATYFEPIQQYDYAARVRGMVNMPGFPTLQDNFDPGRDGPDGGNRLGYDVGYTFIKYWIETYGWESHRAFWQAQVTMNFDEALEFATGKTLIELEDEWRVYIGAPGPAPTLIPIPTMPALPTAPGMSG
jgi:hypothetical protein